MIIRSENLRVEQRTGERLGTSTKLLEEKQMHDEVKVFARVALRPGSRAPLHKHEGSFEVFYILAGKGEVDDNGVIDEVNVGDVVFTDDGESHSIKNIGQTDLEYIALVVITK
jgi:mannose-6-phosphate isomerase-like protein (cupin superfamily)